MQAVNANALPKMAGVEVQDKDLKEGLIPTLKLSSKGCDQVQYSVYLYSPTKKVWENVSGGYTSAVKGNASYTLKLKAPLHEGENSFSVWVKKAGAQPTNKGGYDDAQIQRVTVSSTQAIPKLKSIKIDESSQKAGIKPTMKVTSEGDGNVQYRVYLYSPTKKVWEDVTGGYTEAFSANSTTSLKLNKELHNGENSFSVWVKRAGKDPVNKEGFDNAEIYRVNTSGSSDTTVIPEIKSVNIDSSERKVGVNPTIKITSTGSEKVEYRAYLYSPSKKVWEEVTEGYTSAQDPSKPYALKSKLPLHEGENSFSVWVKRAGKNPDKKEGFDNAEIYRVNASGDSGTSTIIPEIKSVNIDSSERKVGVNPTINITSTGSEKVEYRVYLYSPSKKVWEDATGGYTSAQDPTKPYAVKSNIPLHEGENSFSVWVKRAGKNPDKKEGFDNAEIYRVNAEGSKTIPEITSVKVDSSESIVGGQPVVSLKSDADVDVQYRVYLYSQAKQTWSDVSNGYTDSKDPKSSTDVKITEPLQPGRNTFSIWVKRAGYPPNDPGGFDSAVQEVVNVSMNTAKTSTISNVSVNENNINVGSKPEITVTGSAGDGSNVSYKALLYSNSQGKWIDASDYTAPIKSGNSTTITLSTPLEEGTNKVLIWAKRAWVNGNVYEDTKAINIDAVKPAPMKKKIVIDPGHGGKDPGAVGVTGTKERDITLSVSLKLGNMLKSAGYNVVYTRTSNDSVAWNSAVQSESLAYRANFANSNGADLFLSIHCNAGGGTGTETFYSSKYPDKDKAFATSIQQELVKSIGLKDRGVKSGNLYVINNTKMTAALTELAFVDTSSDEALLQSDAFQQKCAQGIYNGIVKYK